MSTPVVADQKLTGNCSRCRRWSLYPETCRCKRFECGEPWKGEVSDWHEVFAIDAESAAEICAERFDCEGDYTIARNGEGEIWTRDEDSLVQHWHIEAETRPYYQARETIND